MIKSRDNLDSKRNKLNKKKDKLLKIGWLRFRPIRRRGLKWRKKVTRN